MKFLQGLFLLILTGVLSVAALLTSLAFKWADELPDLTLLDAYEISATSQIFARNGELIGEILPVIGEDRASTNRIPVGLDEVSPAALAAIIASEDDSFFQHYGFDILALGYATYLEFLGDGGRGGSTITFQVIKNVFFADIAEERTVERKAKELMLAIELERRLTKAEILQRYVNVVYWGGNLYGIRAASRAYFNKDPIELDLAEGLYLARLIPTPTRAYDDFVSTRRSMRVVLDNMVAQGVISREAAERAWRRPLQPTGWHVDYDDQGNMVGEPRRTEESIVTTATVSSDLAPHITWAIRDQLLRDENFGYNRLFGSGGLRIYTTIDVQAQRSANQASLEADVPPGAEVAMVGLNPQTGEILAVVGGRITEGQPLGEFNRAMGAWRQPGSSFKPIIYATAIEQGGYSQADVVSDAPVVFRQRGQPDWVPRNHDNLFQGQRTLRQHLNVSRNIPVIKLVEAVTPEAVVSRARELGYTTLQPFMSLALGSFEVTVLQHTSAIGAFANGGVHVDPFIISRIEDAEGNLLWEAKRRETRVWSEQTAYIMLDMLNGNVADPGAFSLRAQLDGRWSGGKTGTTNDERDIWYVGITPGFVSAVWIGYDDNRPIPTVMPSGERVTSSRQPIYIWKNFVEAAIQGMPAVSEFPVPEGIVFRNVDLSNGSPSNSGVRAAFRSGVEPVPPAQRAPTTQVSITIPIDTTTGNPATSNTPYNSIEWRIISPDEIANYSSN